MKASYFKYVLEFKRPSGTSRGVLLDKETFILEISENEKKKEQGNVPSSED